MEGELWKGIYQVLERVGKNSRFKGLQFSDRTIVSTFLWAVLHDRPVSWACRRENWPKVQAWESLPSPSTMSRRLRTPSCRQLLRDVEQHLRGCFPHRCCKWIDARPLPVGGSTQDPDAHFGRAAGCKAKGYKLYAICDSSQVLDAWEVHPMNVSEKKVAQCLIPQLQSEGYLVGDKLYDANNLYELAHKKGMQLIAPKCYGEGLGHRRNSPARLRGLELAGRPFGRALLEGRAGIDRCFGHMSNFGGGLGPLPNWVRTLPRVRLWIQAKIIINTVRIAKKQRLIA